MSVLPGNLSGFQTVSVHTLAVEAPIGDYRETAERYGLELLENKFRRSGESCIVICPEISLGYERHRAFLQPQVCEMEWELMLQYIVPNTSGTLVLWGLPVRVGNAVYNGMAYIFDGKVVALSAKSELAQGGIYQDALYFSPLQPGYISEIYVRTNNDSHQLEAIPFGDLVVDAGGVRVKALNCEDLWTVQGPIVRAQEQGADIILWMNTSHEQLGKNDFRHSMLKVFSQLSSTAIIGCNAIGLQGGNHIFGGGAIGYANGKCLGTSPRYQYSGVCTSKFLVDLRQRNLFSVNF